MVTYFTKHYLRVAGLSFLVIFLFLNSCTKSTPTLTLIAQPQLTILNPSITIEIEFNSSTQTPDDTQQSSRNALFSSATPTPSLGTPDHISSSQFSSATDQSPNDWMFLPVIPSLSQTARMIYQRGLEMGNDPHSFSKIGDCQSIPTYFLSYFDMPGYYNLGYYASLQETINWYSGSFSRDSLAVKGGFNAAAILSPLRADPQQCKPNENPIECEFRVYHPSVALISLEEWWAGHPENYETYMRQIIEYTIQQGVVPIIATKADNLEGNNMINQTIARLAHEYEIPLWNFWLAVQPLPNHGLISIDSSGDMDMFHLTHSEGYYFYNDPANTQSGWSIRNLTALQSLDAVRRALIGNP
jgi:hypothetical protein